MPETIYNPKRIDQLPAASALSDADLIPIMQAGVTKKATKAQVSVGVSGPCLAQIVNASGSATFELPAGTYIQAIIMTGNTGSVKIGTSAGGGQIVDDSVVTGTPLVYSLVGDAFYASATTLHFTGTFKTRLLLWLIGE